MPWSALPEHLNSPEKWAGTDDDTPLMRWRLKIKGWFAFGPRALQKWAQWRENPITLFAIWDGGPIRIENNDGSGEDKADAPGRIVRMVSPKGCHFSRVQYWCRWHVAIQWPLQISFHYYKNAADVPRFPLRPGPDKVPMVFGYGPTHRDADNVYWFPSFFVGGVWK